MAITMPERSTVNGLRIAGWMLEDENGSIVPAFYCEGCMYDMSIEPAIRDNARRDTAIPLYSVNLEQEEYCDTCFGPLT